MECDAKIGEVLLETYGTLKVDVHHPDILLQIELREQVNIYSETIEGPGGMPVGTGGKAMLLLSGGIDSPVAGYLIAKRGVTVDAVFDVPLKQSYKGESLISSRDLPAISINEIEINSDLLPPME